MFLRILGGFVALVVLVWVVLYFVASSSLRDAEREPWPYDLGTIQQSLAANNTRPVSNEARQIAKLMDALPAEEATADAYLAAQSAKDDDTIDAPPPDAGLAGHDAAIAELTRAVVAADHRIVWAEAGAPWNTEAVVNVLGASALDHARNGDAAGAWERVHAVWLLARSMSNDSFRLDGTLKVHRVANAVARKLSPPVPTWAGELAAFDPRREMAAIMFRDTASRIRTIRMMKGPIVILRPFSDSMEASNARRVRAAAQSMANAPRCRIDLSEESAHSGDIYRASRIDAEFEATEKLLALTAERARLGRWPETLPGGGASRCADNRWIYDVKPGGKSMSLRMSFEVAPEPEVKNAPALRFEY
ncbi:MAG TPA: hypothetical protein VJZ76_16210 [Thermoanaerobaculia bacterium]|nr:hypothetical protein [Thermoanaerobaculia bacterium]